MESGLKRARFHEKVVAERFRSKKLREQNRQLRTSVENLLVVQCQCLDNLRGTVSRREIRFSSYGKGKKSSSAEAAVADISRKLIEAQEQERARLARELHDDISQRLVLLAVGIEQVHKDVAGPLDDVQNRLSEIRKQTMDISTAIRDLAHELHSSSLEYLGFVSAVKNLAGELRRRQKMEIKVKNDGVPNALPAEISLCLYRIVQEALHNAVKHSGAKYVEVHLQQTSDQIQITLRDCGKGFDVGAAGNGRGLGLASMRERIRLVNGTIVIRSKPTAGTIIRACVPFPTIVLPPIANC